MAAKPRRRIHRRASRRPDRPRGYRAQRGTHANAFRVAVSRRDGHASARISGAPAHRARPAPVARTETQSARRRLELRLSHPGSLYDGVQAPGRRHAVLLEDPDPCRSVSEFMRFSRSAKPSCGSPMTRRRAAASTINPISGNWRANMQANAKCSDDPWMRTIGLLSVLSGAPDSGMAEIAALAAGAPRSGAMPPFMAARRDVQVQLIDRPSQSTATIAWRDSTHCSYGDQVWHACRARLAGVCATSGGAI